MAQRLVTTLIDDIDGGPGDETLTFSLQGQTYEIDLSKANAQKMLRAMEPYLAHARKNGGRRSVNGPLAGAGAGREQLAAMRKWARENGYEVSDRGRVSVTIQNAYHAAH